MRIKLLSIAAAILLSAVWCMPAFSQGIMPLPHAFYGNLTINGAPAPVSAIIEARGTDVITGGQNNPLTTTEPGKYGSASPNEPRLLVTGYMAEGTLISFYTGGVAADQTAAWHSGVLQKLDLTFTIPGQLEIKKVDGSGNALGGATFVITPNPKTGTGSLTVADNGSGDENPAAGMLLVSAVRLNIEYTVRESIAPSGYQAAADQKATLTSPDKVTLTFINTSAGGGGGGGGGGGAFSPTPTPTPTPTATTTTPPGTAVMTTAPATPSLTTAVSTTPAKTTAAATSPPVTTPSVKPSATLDPSGTIPAVTPGPTTTVPGTVVPGGEPTNVNWGLTAGIIAGVAVIAGVVMAVFIRRRSG